MARIKRQPGPDDEADRARLMEVWSRYKREHRVTQHEMGKRLNMTQGAFSAYLNGRAQISLQFIMDFADIVGCSPQDISPSLANNRHLLPADQNEILANFEALDKLEKESFLRILKGMAARSR